MLAPEGAGPWVREASGRLRPRQDRALPGLLSLPLFCSLSFIFKEIRKALLLCWIIRGPFRSGRRGGQAGQAGRGDSQDPAAFGLCSPRAGKELRTALFRGCIWVRASPPALSSLASPTAAGETSPERPGPLTLPALGCPDAVVAARPAPGAAAAELPGPEFNGSKRAPPALRPAACLTAR